MALFSERLSLIRTIPPSETRDTIAPKNVAAAPTARACALHLLRVRIDVRILRYDADATVLIRRLPRRDSGDTNAVVSQLHGGTRGKRGILEIKHS